MGYLAYEHPIFAEVLKFISAIIALALLITIAVLLTKFAKAPEITTKENNIISYSTMDSKNESIFEIGNNGKYYLVYESSDNGGITLQEYIIDKTEIFQTLSANENPFVKVYNSKYRGVDKVEMYVPENTFITNSDNSTKADDDEAPNFPFLIIMALSIITSATILIKSNV